MVPRRRFLVVLAGFLSAPSIARCETYAMPGEAAARLLPGETLKETTVELSDDEVKAIEKACGLRVRNASLRAFRSSKGAWVIIDQVIGKHEFIDWACLIGPDGGILGAEILVYRETYGDGIRNPKWLAQFRGKKAGADFELDSGVKNISGATLSCKHIAEASKRLVHTWEIALKKR